MLTISKIKLVSVNIFIMLLILSCSQPEDIQRKNVIEKIEKIIILPKNSNKLGNYARYYTGDAKSIVTAIYTNYPEEIIPSIRLATKLECVQTNNKSYPCNDPHYGIIEPGKSKWIDKYIHMPIADGGGCTFIEIKYDNRVEKIISIECNGPY